VLGLSVLLFFFAQGRVLPISPLLIAFIVSLFALCMFCQYELYRSRPKGKEELTTFYLWVSFGGFAGSVFVTWLAPLLFTAPIEFLAGLFIIGLSLFIRQGELARPFRLAADRLHRRVLGCLAAAIRKIQCLRRDADSGQLRAYLPGAEQAYERTLRRPARHPDSRAFSEKYWSRDGEAIGSFRNYYGIYRINYRAPVLSLLNGTTLHGAQYFGNEKAKMNEPLTYYHRNTPVVRCSTAAYSTPAGSASSVWGSAR